MKNLLILVSFLTMAACVSAPPSSEQIKQKVAALLGEATDPGSPFPRVTLEPTGVRWTIFRNDVEVSQNLSHSMQPAGDGIVGIEFGHGLFLDSQGNLSIVPKDLWPDYWHDAVRYDGKMSLDVWQGSTTEIVGFEKTPSGVKSYRPGSFGTKVEDFDLKSGDDILAASFFRKASRTKDGAWQESDQKQLLAPAQIYRDVDTGAQHTAKSFVETNTDYKADDQGVRASDKSLSIKNLQDHWEITLPAKTTTKRWLAYFGSTKALLIDTQTGQTISISQTANGAELVSSIGHKESLVANNN